MRPTPQGPNFPRPAAPKLKNLLQNEPAPDAVKFRTYMPRYEWTSLKRGFLIHIDEIDFNPDLPQFHHTQRSHPIKFAAYGSFKEPDPSAYGAEAVDLVDTLGSLGEQLFKIRFYELCPDTHKEMDCFACVEWRVNISLAEMKFWNGKISLPACGLDIRKDSLGKFLSSMGEYKERRQDSGTQVDPTVTKKVLMDRKGTCHILKHTIQPKANTNVGLYLNARAYSEPKDHYSVLINLQEADNEERVGDGKLEMYNIPRPEGMRCRDSPLLQPLVVWLLLTVLGRDQEAFTTPSEF